MWTGECNQCGQCCTFRINTKVFKCQHLLILDALGRPGATHCSKQDEKYYMMPIFIVSEDGEKLLSNCIPDYPRRTDAVPPECSYQFKPDELVKIKPLWSFTWGVSK